MWIEVPWPCPDSWARGMGTISASFGGTSLIKLIYLTSCWNSSWEWKRSCSLGAASGLCPLPWREREAQRGLSSPGIPFGGTGGWKWDVSPRMGCEGPRGHWCHLPAQDCAQWPWNVPGRSLQPLWALPRQLPGVIKLIKHLILSTAPWTGLEKAAGILLQKAAFKSVIL